MVSEPFKAFMEGVITTPFDTMQQPNFETKVISLDKEWVAQASIHVGLLLS
jgi:hypothetical protein